MAEIYPADRTETNPDLPGWDPRLTEARNPRTTDIDLADARTIVAMMQAEDRAVPAAVESQAGAIARVIDELSERFRRGGRLIYVGAGTSGRLGVLDASECPPTFGTDPDLVQGIIAGGVTALVRSSEGAEDDPAAGAAAVRDATVGRDDFVLGIASSGTTPYVRGALSEARARGAGLGFLSCSAPPDDVRALDPVLITPLVGPEVVAGSTRLKAGTATKLVLNAVTTGAMIRSGKVFGNLMVDLRARSAKLVDRGIRIVSHVCEVEPEAARVLLVRAGGSVKTAIAMQRLGLSRALAERALDAADGFLRVAIDRFGDRRFPYYEAYPAEPGWPDRTRIVTDLSGLTDRLARAFENGRGADAREDRVVGPPGGWTAAEHVAHLLAFEREAVLPRVVSALTLSDPTWDEWEPSESVDADRPFDEILDDLAAERARTVARLNDAPADALGVRARLGAETPTLYQFLRGIRQHDEAHALRIEQRVHPALLESREVAG